MSTCGVIELWITPCGALGINFGNRSLMTAEETYVGGWAYFRVPFERTTENGVDHTWVSWEFNGGALTPFDEE